MTAALISVGLTAAIFCTALIVGVGGIAVVRRRDFDVRDVLLAPAIGFGIVMLVAVPVTRIGIPVNAFGAYEIIGLVLLSAGAIAYYRKLVLPKLRRSAAFGLIITVAFFLTASPMLSFGLNWFSYSNDDAINYAFSAERLRTEGLYTVPRRSDFISDRDVREDYYLQNGSQPDRYGADELLAVASATSRIDAFHALMAMLVALHLAGIAAVGALAYRGTRAYATAIVASIALSASALATFGVEYQLLGQVSGLLFLSAAVAQVCIPKIDPRRPAVRASDWIPGAVLFAALCEAYPEMAPFAFLVIVGYHVFEQPLARWATIAYLCSVAAGSALILNANLQNVLYAIALRSSTGGGSSANSLFPYFLIPPGVPNFFGLISVASFPSEPWMSLSIVGGLALFAALMVATATGIRRGEPAAYLNALYIIFLGYFFFRQSGFPLFKLAMYAQPAMLAVLSAAVVRLAHGVPSLRTRLPVIGAVAVVCLSIASQQVYVSASRAEKASKSANFVEIRGVSEAHLLDALAVLRGGLRDNDNVVSDTFNTELAELESYFTHAEATISFPVGDVERIATLIIEKARFADARRLAAAKALVIQRDHRFSVASFRNGSLQAHFRVDRENRSLRSVVWIHDATDSPFNRATIHGPPIQIVPEKTRNVLSFVSSTLGYPYFSTLTPLSIYQLEPDYYYPGDTMAAVGRYLLFEVIHPARPLRVRLALTRTLLTGDDREIPQASVIGDNRGAFATIGRGSADLVSAVVEPKIIDGRSYILLDMGAPPKRSVIRRTGLMQLWGRDIPIDRRLLTAFVRDVSAVDVAFDRIAPTRIAAFPDDLKSPRVEYSGLYEDGWASDNFSVTLTAPESGTIHLRGLVPQIGTADFRTTVSCRVDGFPNLSQQLGVGELDLALVTGRGVHRIACRFSDYQRLPGGDGRPVSMRISLIG